MAKISLFEKLTNIKLTELEWTSFRKQVSSLKDGETERNIYLTLDLAEPKEKVVGSQFIFDPEDQLKKIPVMAHDVFEVNVNLSVIAKFAHEFSFDEDAEGNLTGPGKYSGDLMLDVSRSGQVWLTDEKLSKVGSDFRNKAKKATFDQIYARWKKKTD
jgi:hypothetical protein